ncbi:exodeoxyribonuclease III [Desulfothermobacter acidiphilus]|uniref:exodeoxyribonuclease III n=1 Tax=Desulfothermobacter acidiphilus TaxID=1938353 RepID=UPI003F8A7D52
MQEPRVFISWNVNGLRALLRKGLLDFIRQENADAYLFQEVKTSEIPPELKDIGYQVFLNPANRSGYSGTLTLLRPAPLSYRCGLGVEEFDAEGRVQIFEFPSFYLLNVYFPNAQRELARLDYKLRFNEAFGALAQELRMVKPLVIGGDFNVAHQEIDIARPKENEHNAGFTREEREWMTRFLAAGYIDTFREFVKEPGHYSWWTYRFRARERNVGWRVDYFLVSEELRNRLVAATILEQVQGSDHAPVKLVLAPPTA